LSQLVDLFRRGVREPIHLYVEPSFSYANQLKKKTSQKTPLQVGLESLQNRLEKGYEPEWELLFSSREFDQDLETGFETLSLEIMGKVMESDLG